MSKAFGINLIPADIEEIHQLKGRQQNNSASTLVMRFAAPKVLRKFMYTYIKNAKKCDTAALGHNVSERIYISDNLTRKNAMLRKKAMELKKASKIAGFNVHKGAIYVTLAEGERSRSVSSVGELLALINPDLEDEEKQESAQNEVGNQLMDQ